MGVCCAARDIDTGLERNRSESKLGRKLDIDWLNFTPDVIEALKIAYEKRGGPVYTCEVHEELKKISYNPVKFMHLTKNTLWNLFADDKILCNRELTLYSLNPLDQSTLENESEFELFSDRMARIGPGYDLKFG